MAAGPRPPRRHPLRRSLATATLVLFWCSFPAPLVAQMGGDFDGDGVIGGPEYGLFSSQYGGPPGPSGLACAGSPPCPAPADEPVVYYHGDHLGSTTVLTGPAGNVVARVLYEPFGEALLPASPPGNQVPEFAFTGQRFEADLALYDYGARFYDPALGRFLQPDPIVPEPGDPQSLNRYSYVRNNPLTRIDPTGNDDGTFITAAPPPSFGNAFLDPFGGLGFSSFAYGLSSYLGFWGTYLQDQAIPYWQSYAASTPDPLLHGNFEDYVRASLRHSLFDSDNLTAIGYEALGSGFSVLSGVAAPPNAGDVAFTLATLGAGAVPLRATRGVGGGSRVFERVVSRAELEATQSSGLLRGGRSGRNFFTNNASLDAKRAQQRLGLDGPLRDFRIRFSVADDVKVSGSGRVPGGQSGTPGGGREFFTDDLTPVEILRVDPLRR